MTKSNLINAVILSATTALAGCATDNPLLKKASDGFDAARRTVSNAIAPSAPASAASAATAAPVETAKKLGVTWNSASCEEKLKDKKGVTAAVVGGARQATATYTSPNKECVAVQIKDTKKDSKVPVVSYYGDIAIESCSPTVVGAATNAGKAIAGHATTIFGNMIGQKANGVVGNVVKTEAQRQGVEMKKGVMISGLTEDQQKQCQADLTTLSAEIKSSASKWAAEYEKANKGAKAAVTYSSTADVNVLQLNAPTRGISLERR